MKKIISLLSLTFIFIFSIFVFSIENTQVHNMTYAEGARSRDVQVDCSSCDEGRILCTVCYGNYINAQPCTVCDNNDGKCPQCHGVNSENCSYCDNHNGFCLTCHGSGFVDCSNCYKGIESCKICSGLGTVTIQGYLITYDSNGVTPSEEIVQPAAVEPNTTLYSYLLYELSPEEEGTATFVEWSTSSTEYVSPPYGVTEDITLYAMWEKHHKVNYELDGGCFISSYEPEEYTNSQNVIDLPYNHDPDNEIVTKEGFYFLGWFFDDSFNNFASFVGTDEYYDSDITVYAKWQKIYSVSYDVGTGVTETADARSGFVSNTSAGNLTVFSFNPNNFTKTGYVFGGLYLDSSFTPSSEITLEDYGYCFSNDSITDDVTIYVKWIKTQKITYELDGGTITGETTQVDINNEYTQIYYSSLTKTGYVFGGFYYDSTFNSILPSDYWTGYYFETPSEDIVLYVKWVKLYTITYELNGGTDDGDLPSNNDPYDSYTYFNISSLHKDGYKLEGLYLDSTFNTKIDYIYEYPAIDNSIITADFKVYVKWTLLPRITFVLNGGSFSSEYTPITSISDSTYTYLPSRYECIKDNYILSGWYKKDVYTKDNYIGFSLSNSTVTEDITLYAYWGKEYALNFEYGNLEPIDPFDTTYLSGKVTYLPSGDSFINNPMFRLKGWHLDQNLEDDLITYIDPSYVGNKTFYAEIENANKIKYRLNGGSFTLSSSSIEYYFDNQSVDLRKDAIKDGYNLIGWNTNRDLSGDPILSFNENEYTGEVILYAVWEEKPITYSITYAIGNHSFDELFEFETSYYQHDDTINLPYGYCFIYSGEEFVGWYDNPEFEGEAYESFSTDRTGDITFYAKFKKPRQIIYHLNGGHFTNNNYATQYDNYWTTDLPTNVEYTGHTFIGWYDNETLDGTFYSINEPYLYLETYDDIDLYAAYLDKVDRIVLTDHPLAYVNDNQTYSLLTNTVSFEQDSIFTLKESYFNTSDFKLYTVVTADTTKIAFDYIQNSDEGYYINLFGKITGQAFIPSQDVLEDLNTEYNFLDNSIEENDIIIITTLSLAHIHNEGLENEIVFNKILVDSLDSHPSGNYYLTGDTDITELSFSGDNKLCLSTFNLNVFNLYINGNTEIYTEGTENKIKVAGAIYVYGTLTINGITIESYYDETEDSITPLIIVGDINNSKKGTLVINNSSIIEGDSSDYVSTIMVHDGTLTINNSTIKSYRKGIVLISIDLNTTSCTLNNVTFVGLDDNVIAITTSDELSLKVNGELTFTDINTDIELTYHANNNNYGIEVIGEFSFNDDLDIIINESDGTILPKNPKILFKNYYSFNETNIDSKIKYNNSSISLYKDGFNISLFQFGFIEDVDSDEPTIVVNKDENVTYKWYKQKEEKEYVLMTSDMIQLYYGSYDNDISKFKTEYCQFSFLPTTKGLKALQSNGLRVSIASGTVFEIEYDYYYYFDDENTLFTVEAYINDEWVLIDEDYLGDDIPDSYDKISSCFKGSFNYYIDNAYKYRITLCSDSIITEYPSNGSFDLYSSIDLYFNYNFNLNLYIVKNLYEEVENSNVISLPASVESGTYKATATYNSYTATSNIFTYTKHKRIPTFDVPESINGYSILYYSDHTPPTGFVFDEVANEVISETNGSKFVYLKYIPTDTDNYITIEDIEVLMILTTPPDNYDATLSSTSYTYTGSELKPTVTVTNNRQAVDSSNYTVTYTSNVNSGTATVTITGTNIYIVKTFTIAKAKVTVPTKNTNLVYTGDLVTGVTLPNNAKYTLYDNADYNAGSNTAIAELSDKNNYVWDLQTPTTDDQYILWSIEKVKVAVPTANTDLVFTGNNIVGVTKPAGAKYSLFGNEEMNAGSYTAIASLSDPDNYVWDLVTPTSMFQEIQWSIAKAKVNEPTIITTSSSFVFDNTEKEVILSGVESYMTKSNNSVTKAKAKGTYTITYTLDNNHIWNDNNDGIISWSITKAQATITVDTTPIVKTYGEQFTLPTATSNLGIVTCDTLVSSLVNADSYTVTYTVVETDDYAGDTKTLSVTINKKELTVPTLTGSYTYNGSEQSVTINDFDSNTMKYADDSISKATDAKSYKVKVSLKDTVNYKWSTTFNGELDWSIEKLKVNEPTVSGTYTYTGNAQTVTLTGAESYMSTTSSLTATNAGDHTITYTLDDNHEWNEGVDGIVTWTILKANAAISVDTTTITKTFGETFTLPTATSNFGTVLCDKVLSDLVNPGVYTVIYSVNGTDNYNGDTKSLTVKIKPITLDNKEEGQTLEKADVIVSNNKGFDLSIELEINIIKENLVNTVTTYMKENLNKLSKNEKVGAVYDIKLIKVEGSSRTEIQPNENETIKVKILIPNEIDINKVTKVMHLHSLSDVTEIAFNKEEVDENRYYEIEVDRFSEFAFIYKIDEPSINNSFPWWGIVLIVLGTIIILFVGLFFIWKFEYNKYIKNNHDLNDRKLSFIDKVYKPINNLIFKNNIIE